MTQTWPSEFKDETGQTRLDGELILKPAAIVDANTLDGVAINNTPSTGEVLTAVDPSNAQWAAGGGSSPVKIVRVPVAFDTPGQFTSVFAITVVNQGTQTVTIAGNHAALFPVGSHFDVFGSTGNDNTYTVVSATFGAATEIVTAEALPDATADGNVIGPAVGTVIYTPTVKDLLVTLTFSVTIVWDGSNPAANVTLRGDSVLHPIANEDLTQIDDPDSPVPGMSQPVDLLAATNFGFFDTTTPLVLVVVDGTTFANPNSSQGEGEIILEIFSAP